MWQLLVLLAVGGVAGYLLKGSKAEDSMKKGIDSVSDRLRRQPASEEFVEDKTEGTETEGSESLEESSAAGNGEEN